MPHKLVKFIFDHCVNLLRKFILNVNLQKSPELSPFYGVGEDKSGGEVQWKLSTTTLFLYLLTRNLS